MANEEKWRGSNTNSEYIKHAVQIGLANECKLHQIQSRQTRSRLAYNYQ